MVVVVSTIVFMIGLAIFGQKVTGKVRACTRSSLAPVDVFCERRGDGTEISPPFVTSARDLPISDVPDCSWTIDRSSANSRVRSIIICPRIFELGNPIPLSADFHRRPQFKEVKAG